MTPAENLPSRRDSVASGSVEAVPSAELDGSGSVAGAIDDGFAEMRDEITAFLEDIRSFRAEFKRDLARQTCVILASFAAAMTPIYIALFTGVAG